MSVVEQDNVEAVKAGALEGVVVRFAGDSGDGMQLTGDPSACRGNFRCFRLSNFFWFG
jgi:hypothetical protein